LHAGFLVLLVKEIPATHNEHEHGRKDEAADDQL
jgi:hypothetical protein